MRNRILVFAVAIGTVGFSGCGIFRKKEKQKYSIEVDSTSTKSTLTNNVDTGKILTYRRTTYYNPLNSKIVPDNFLNNFGYPYQLINATKKLEESTSRISAGNKTSSGNVSNRNSGGVPGIASTVEEWSLESKGKSSSSAIHESSEVGKNTKGTSVKTEGNSKTILVISIVGGFVLVILFIFVFLYIKSRIPGINKK